MLILLHMVSVRASSVEQHYFVALVLTGTAVYNAAGALLAPLAEPDFLLLNEASPAYHISSAVIDLMFLHGFWSLHPHLQALALATALFATEQLVDHGARALPLQQDRGETDFGSIVVIIVLPALAHHLLWWSQAQK